jgi:hypothetical protein
LWSELHPHSSGCAAVDWFHLEFDQGVIRRPNAVPQLAPLSDQFNLAGVWLHCAFALSPRAAGGFN